MATSPTLTSAEPFAAAAAAVADAPPSNWITLASMQRLAKKPSSFATYGDVCTTLGGATDTPMSILRMVGQLCAAAGCAFATTASAAMLSHRYGCFLIRASL